MIDRKVLGGVVSLLIIASAGVTAFIFLGNFTAISTNNKIGVAVTIPVQSEIVKMVGGDRVEVTVLVPPGADPHSYEPTPSQLTELSEAQLYYFVGSGLEFELAWWDQILSVNPSIILVNASEGVDVIGDDPHIWGSPINVMIMAENFYEALAKIDPDNKNQYKINRDGYLDALGFLDAHIRSSFENFTNRHFLVFHPAFGYLAKDYNLTQISIEEEGKAVTPQMIQWAVDNATLYNLSKVFVSPQSDSSYAQTIAEQIGGQLVSVDPLAENYFIGMLRMVSELVGEFE